MQRRRLVSNEENDVHTSWRRLYVWTQRTGATAKVKQRTNRRERREGKAQLRHDVDA